MSGALSSACACRSDSQFPTRMPVGFRALHASDPGRQLRREQPVVGRLDGQLANG